MQNSRLMIEARGGEGVSVKEGGDIPSQNKLEKKIFERKEQTTEDTSDEGKELIDPKFIDRVLRHYSKNEKFVGNRAPGLTLVKKIIKERMLIDAAKVELESEKASIKENQAKLARAKENWKQQKRSRPQSDNFKDLLRRKSAKINEKASELNSRVEEVKRAQHWINERQRKLELLESTMISGGDSLGRGLVDGDPLEKLTKELDDDYSAFELSSTPSSSITQSSGRARPRFSSHRRFKESQVPPDQDSGKRQGYYARPPPYPPTYFFDPNLGFYRMQPPLPPPMFFNDEISEVYTRAVHGPIRFGHWTAPMHESNKYNENIIKLTAFQRKDITALETKRQLQEITNRLAATKEAYDNHAK